jgi:hypothetical protein
MRAVARIASLGLCLWLGSAIVGCGWGSVPPPPKAGEFGVTTTDATTTTQTTKTKRKKTAKEEDAVLSGREKRALSKAQQKSE